MIDLKKLRENENWTQKEMAEKLEIPLVTYKRMESNANKRRFADVKLFLKLATILKIDPIDVVTADCPLREQLSSVSLEEKTEESFDEFLHELEKKYGRFAVYNLFPSSIYYETTSFSMRRYDFLSNLQESSDHTLRNSEFYPIDKVVDFGFSIVSRFSKDGKVAILDKIIKNFSKSSSGNGSQYKDIHIFDPKAADFYHDASTCTFITKTATLLMPSPTSKYDMLKIRSEKMAKKMNFYNRMNEEIVLSTKLSVQILEILRDCLKSTGDVYDFLEQLKNDNRKSYEMVVKYLSPDIINKISD